MEVLSKMITFAFFKLDERSKKVALVLLALFIIILLVFGLIYLIVDKYMQHESKKMDAYMVDLLKYGLVTNTHQFKDALNYFEKRSLYNNSKWPIRIIVALTLISLLVIKIFFEGNFNSFFVEAFKLIPTIKWQTIGEVNEALRKIDPNAALIPGFSWLPVSLLPNFISKNPNFSNPMLYFSAIYYIIMLSCIFVLTKAILGYISRVNRGNKLSISVFKKDLDKFDISTVEDFANQINSNVPQQ